MPGRTDKPLPLRPFEIAQAYKIFTLSAIFLAIYQAAFAGAPFTGFLVNLGVSNFIIGLILAFGTIGNVFQLLSAYILERGVSRKRTVVVAGLLSRILIAASIMALFLFPRQAVGLKIAFISILLLFSSSIGSLGSVAWLSWVNDIIISKNRGRFFGVRLALLSIITTVVGLIFGYTLDFLGRGLLGFAVVFGIGMAAGLIDALMQAKVKEPVFQSIHSDTSFLNMVKKPFADGMFKRFIIFSTIMNLAVQVASPFAAVYMLHTLKTSYFSASLASAFYALFSTLSFWAWGILSDTYGNRPTLLIGTILTAIAPLCWVMTSPENYIMMYIGYAISGLGWPGVSLAINNMLLGMGSDEDRAMNIGSVSFLNAIALGIGPLLGGAIADLMKGSSLDLAFIHLGGFQLFFIIGAMVRFAPLPLLLFIREEGDTPARYVFDRLKSPDTPGIFVGLLALRRGRDVGARRKAARKLAMPGADMAVSELIEALHDSSPDVREEAAGALGEIGSPSAVDALQQRMDDPSLNVRLHSIRALGKIGDRNSVAMLMKFLNSDDIYLRASAAEALGNLGDNAAATALLYLLKSGSHPFVLASTADALSKMGEKGALEFILPAMHEAETPVLRSQLANAVGNLLGREGEFYIWQKMERDMSGSLILQRTARLEKLLRRHIGLPSDWSHLTSAGRAFLGGNICEAVSTFSMTASLLKISQEQITGEKLSLTPDQRSRIRVNRWFMEQADIKAEEGSLKWEEALLDLYALQQLSGIAVGTDFSFSL